MKRLRTILKWFMTLCVITLIVMVVKMFVMIEDIQGNARVVNYTGIVRGGIQRLVKQELRRAKNDGLMLYIDDVLKELNGDGEKYNLVKIKDKQYKNDLLAVTDEWKTVKSYIYYFRGDGQKYIEQLYIASESAYELTNNLVASTEKYADTIADNLKRLQYVMVGDIILILLVLMGQVVEGIRLANVNRRLNNMAYVDENTGLPNKRCCEDKLHDGGIITDKENACCIMFDLNNLKIINDTKGHKVGDILIYNFAHLLRMAAPRNMFVGRFGGDEFIAILRNCTEAEIQNYIINLNTSVKHYNENEDNIQISFAYGYALSNGYEGVTMQLLMDIADKKMYEKKSEMKKGEARI